MRFLMTLFRLGIVFGGGVDNGDVDFEADVMSHSIKRPGSDFTPRGKEYPVCAELGVSSLELQTLLSEQCPQQYL